MHKERKQNPKNAESLPSLDSMMHSIYDTLKHTKMPHTYLDGIAAEQIVPRRFGKYYFGLAFSLLMFACNDFDAAKTMWALTSTKSPRDPVESMINSFKNEGSQTMEEKIGYILRG